MPGGGRAGGGRQRASDLGLVFGQFARGPLNAITDVPGIRVGQVTLADGDSVRTGVTAIVPDAVDVAGGSAPAGLFVGNGFGKLTGATQLAELGSIETPVVLTGTLSAFRAADALVTYMLALPGNEGMRTVNPVVGETNDGYLSDIRARPVTEQHVIAAIRGARDGQVAEGAAGAGTGTAALGYKSGIGTASRVVRLAGPHGSPGSPGPPGRPGTVGVLVQSNFSGVLTVRGVPVTDGAAGGPPPAGNSCMIVVATDHGLGSRQLGRVARRAVFAMGRTGADFAGSSGDYAIAIGVPGAQAGRRFADEALGPVFAAVQDAVEEAIVNSLLMAVTTTGYRGHVARAVPIGAVTAACRAAGLIPRR